MTTTQTIQTDRERAPNFGRRDSVDKVARYQWKLRDRPGDQLWIPKEQLLVDHGYQRTANDKKIIQIASNWSWVACGSITAARRSEDGAGRLYVVDGQHRVLAAQRRSDIRTMPCLVFEIDGVNEEATGFLAANTLRKPLDGVAKFRALVMTGDREALFVKGLVDISGRTVAPNTNAGTIACVTALMAYARRYSRELERIWSLLIRLCEGRGFHERIMRGLCFIESHLPEGESITRTRWANKIEQIGFDELLNSAARASSFYSRGGDKIWAEGMLQAINKSVRSHKLTLAGSTNEDETEEIGGAVLP